MHLPEQALGFGKAGSSLGSRAAFTGATWKAGSGLWCQRGMAAAQSGLLPCGTDRGKEEGNKNGDRQVGDSWGPFRLLSHQWYLTVSLRCGEFSYFALILEALTLMTYIIFIRFIASYFIQEKDMWEGVGQKSLS